MTGPHDDSDTRPISVAELLARNGTIGAPPVGGRRRRRRGNADAVTVAELTGEIPIIRDDVLAEQEQEATNGAVDTEAEPEVMPAAEVEPGVEPEAADEPVVTDELDGRAHDLDAEVSAEEMLPDRPHLQEDIDFDEDTEDQDAAVAVEEHRQELDEHEDLEELEEDDERAQPSYLDAVQEPLFGGRTDELSHGELSQGEATQTITELPEVPPETTTAEDHEETLPPTRLQKIGRGVLVVLQSILAVAFGAGLFIAFDELWRWNSIVALVLSVLVILGLVIAVRVVRKTEDIASTLIAVAVGALVTLGPLALLQSG
jgi:hypothetical protein